MDSKKIFNGSSFKLAMLVIIGQCIINPVALGQDQTQSPAEAEIKYNKVTDTDLSLNHVLEFIKKKDYQKAIEYCSTMISTGEPNSDFYFFRAMAFQRISKNKEAIEDLSKALQLKPRNAEEILCYRASSYHTQGELDLALEDCNASIRLDPNFPGSYEKRAEIYLEKENFSESIADWSKAIELAPIPFNYFDRGLAYEKIGERIKAISDFDSAIKLDSMNSYFYYRRAKAKHLEKVLGDGTAQYADDAIADISKAISLKPKEPVYFLLRSQIYSLLLQVPMAIKDCTTAIQFAPDDDELYIVRGDYYVRANQLNNALSDYSKAITLRPKNSSHYLRRAKVYEKLSLLDKSLQECTKAIEIDPKGGGAKSGLIERGNLYMKQSNFKKAVDDYTKAIAVKTNDKFLDEHAFYRRSKAYSNLGQHSNAIADFAKWSAGGSKDAELFYYAAAIKDYPKEAWTYAGRGEAFRMKGLNKQAIEDCTIAVALNPKFASAYATRGLAYKKVGDEKAALADFHKAISLDPRLAEKLSKLD